MPIGVLEMIPFPLPDLFTTSVGFTISNTTVTVRWLSIVTIQWFAKVASHPLQPPNVEMAVGTLVSGVALSIRLIPDVKVLEIEGQSRAQLTPEGVLVTVPTPNPALLTMML
jgi:hypothetical protein